MRRSRHIVFAATGIFGTSGGIASANRNVLEALRGLAAVRQVSVEVLVANESPGADLAGIPGDVTYRRLGSSRFAFARQLLRLSRRADLIVFDHVRLALPLMAVPRFLLPPVAIAAHGSESWRRIRRTSMTLFRAADLVFTNSDYTLERMRSRFAGFNGVSVPLGLPPTFALRAGPPPASPGLRFHAVDGNPCDLGSRVILLVARLDPGEREKGHRELIDCLPLLVARIPDVQLVFAGSGDDAAALAGLAVDAGVADRVVLAGRLDADRLQQLYDSCAVYAMPSRQEGFGLTYLEAMNSARPCIACRDDGGADVVVHGETGLLVGQPVRREALAEALATLLGDADLAARLGRAGQERLRERFSAAAYQARLRAVLDPLLP